MSTFDKKTLSESDICDLFISPAIKNAGWDPPTQIRREVTLAPGPVIVRGNVASRNKKKRKFADYVLSREPGVPVAVVEAKDNHHTVSQGLQQPLGYAEILNVPSAFTSNGDAFASAALRNERVDAILVADSPDDYTYRRLIIQLIEDLRLPAVYPWRSFVEFGGLMAYSVDVGDLMRHAARQVDQMLNGTKPGEIPFYQATKFQTQINLRTARALGITMPPTLLALADELIE